MKKLKWNLDFSLRYWVVGGYKDRNYPRLRFYIGPMRISVGKDVGWLERDYVEVHRPEGE